MTSTLGRLSLRLSVLLPAAVAPVAVLAVDPGGWYPFGPLRWMVTTVGLLGSATAILAVASRSQQLAAGSNRADAVPGRSSSDGAPGRDDYGGGLAPQDLARDQPRSVHPMFPRPPTVLVRASLVLVAAMAVAAALGLDGLYAWTGTPERNAGVVMWASCGVALFIGAASAHNRLLVAGWVVAGAVLGLTATAEALGWEPVVFDLGDRITGLMGSSAYLGAAAALLLPASVGTLLAGGVGAGGAGVGRGIGLGLGGRGRSGVLRVLPAIAAASLLVALIGSGARAAWLGAGVATVVAGWARRERVLRIIRSVRAPVVVAATATGLALATAVVVASPAADRATALFDADAPGGAGRLDEWRVATRVIAHHPVVGVGPEGYRIAFAEGVDVAYEARHGRDPLPDRAHSGPLDVVLAGGPVALVAWLVVWAVIGRAAWWAMRAGSWVEAGVAAGLMAHWVGQLALFPLAEIEPIAWLMAGWLVARRTATVGLPGGGTAVSSVVNRGRRAGIAVLGAFTVVAFVAGAAGVAADRQADQAASAPLGSGTDLEVAGKALAAAERAVELRPDFVRHHLLLAQVRVASGRGAVGAIEAVDDALAVSPRDPIARLAKGRYLLDRAIATEVPSHADEARDQIWSILADDPLNTEAWALAVLVAATEG